MAREYFNLNNTRHNENRNSLATVSQTNAQINNNKSAPLEGESMQPSKNPPPTELMKVYTAKRRKDNSGKPVEVEDPLGTENAKVEADKENGYNICTTILSSLNMRRKALKVLQYGRSVKAKFAEFCLNRNDDQYTMSIYCKAQVNGELIILILNSGSSDCIVSAGFLKKASIQIVRLLTVMIVGVHGKQKKLIGEIDQFSITVSGKTITSQAVVSEAGNYVVIVENNWMRKARAQLDWEAYKLMIREGNKKIRVLME
ncbi:17897_t:CDS:2 [Gigaspora margarita]|uniref:17897_t:CDS:1 n=1 Tax=Gigaspora margarita TaxID=4874 RepID=A0ABN7UMR7_GIGMA|nr:17897_t:CDS:2 [Gigaspora margarita]